MLPALWVHNFSVFASPLLALLLPLPQAARDVAGATAKLTLARRLMVLSALCSSV